MAKRRGLTPRTIDFTSRVVVTGRVRHVFDVLTDWPRQTAWVPSTVVARPEGGPVGVVGERFVGTTTLGPIVLVDPMEVVAWQAPDADRPGRVSIVKTGDVFGGTVEIVVSAAAEPRSRKRRRYSGVLSPSGGASGEAGAACSEAGALSPPRRER